MKIKSVEDFNNVVRAEGNVDINDVADAILPYFILFLNDDGESKAIRILSRGYRVISEKAFENGDRNGEWISERHLKEMLTTILSEAWYE